MTPWNPMTLLNLLAALLGAAVASFFIHRPRKP